MVAETSRRRYSKILGLLNPLFWQSIAWLIVTIESTMRVRRWFRRGGWLYPLSIGIVSLIPSVWVVRAMIWKPLGELTYMWVLQLSYMPIPPGAVDSTPGISNALEWCFLIGYPILNFGLAIAAWNFFRDRQITSKFRSSIASFALALLGCGKLYFESWVLIFGG